MLRPLLRLVLTLVVLTGSLAIIAPATAADDDGNIRSAWSVFDSGGNWGGYYYTDSSSSPGAECWNHGGYVDITMVGQFIYPNSDYYYQPISVQWQIYKVVSSSSVTLVYSSSTYFGSAYDDAPVDSGSFTVLQLTGRTNIHQRCTAQLVRWL